MSDQKGQILAEFSLVSLLVMVPMVTGGLAWFSLEMSRSKCAYESFYQARRRLILENRAVDYTQACGSVHEAIQLLPLEDLDRNKGGLGPGDFSAEASQLLADASRLSHALQGLASSASSIKSGP